MVWVMVSWDFLRVEEWTVPPGGDPRFDPPAPDTDEREYLIRIGLLSREPEKVLLIINRSVSGGLLTTYWQQLHSLDHALHLDA